MAGEPGAELVTDVEAAGLGDVGGWLASGELLMPSVGVDWEVVPVPVARPPFELHSRRVSHRIGHGTSFEWLVKDLAARLAGCGLVGLFVGGEGGWVDAGG